MTNKKDLSGGSKSTVNTDVNALVEYYLGPVAAYLKEDGVTEICINKFDEIFIERNGEMERVDAQFDNEHDLSTLVTQIANSLGQPCNAKSHPILDARLKDGSRVCAVLFPVSTRGTCITIRVFPKVRLCSNDLIKYDSLTPEMLEYMKLAIKVYGNGLVSGGTGSGKTTLLNITSSFIPYDDRVVTVEDTKELQVEVGNLVALEAPQKVKGEKEQDIDMSFLIKTTLRQRPDRIIVGEVRDANAATAFLHAINTGHSGTCATIHANSPEDALVRMQTLIAGGGGLPFDIVSTQVRSNLHFLVQAERTPTHGRKIVVIGELQMGELKRLWEWDYVKGMHVANKENIAKSTILAKAKIFGLDSELFNYL